MTRMIPAELIVKLSEHVRRGLHGCHVAETDPDALGTRPRDARLGRNQPPKGCLVPRGLGRLRREQRVVPVQISTPQVANRPDGIIRAGGIGSIEQSDVLRLPAPQSKLDRAGAESVTQKRAVENVRGTVPVLPAGNTSLHAGIRRELMAALGGDLAK
ncbi:hypothetical protein ABT024_39085, partial [Streptomyces sp. NPDC002812]|uniref:hypothetical protein n=1 Tax=Streptomyces sp. NPDC002812 TaxID=3154434 RepID=UPI00331B3BFC